MIGNSKAIGWVEFQNQYLTCQVVNMKFIIQRFQKNLYMLHIAFPNKLPYNEYNKLRILLPGVFDTPDILNLHLFIRASHIFVNMSGHRLQWKTEAQVR